MPHLKAHGVLCGVVPKGVLEELIGEGGVGCEGRLSLDSGTVRSYHGSMAKVGGRRCRYGGRRRICRALFEQRRFSTRRWKAHLQVLKELGDSFKPAINGIDLFLILGGQEDPRALLFGTGVGVAAGDFGAATVGTRGVSVTADLQCLYEPCQSGQMDGFANKEASVQLSWTDQTVNMRPSISTSIANECKELQHSLTRQNCKARQGCLSGPGTSLNTYVPFGRDKRHKLGGFQTPAARSPASRNPRLESRGPCGAIPVAATSTAAGCEAEEAEGVRWLRRTTLDKKCRAISRTQTWPLRQGVCLTRRDSTRNTRIPRTRTAPRGISWREWIRRTLRL